MDSYLSYQGAFRLASEDFGVSSVNYAVGALAFDPKKEALYVVGHAHTTAVAEFPVIPAVKSSNVSDLPVSIPVQGFSDLLGKVDNPELIDRITGMVVVGDFLIVNAETWYDAEADNKDTTLFVNAMDLNSAPVGLFQLTGAANCAGYMGRIPIELQDLFDGATFYTGWSSVYSITSRYSQGPSLWTFSPQDMLGDPAAGREVEATAWVNYAFESPSQWLSPRGIKLEPQGTAGPFPPADDLWNPLAKGLYGFFVPNTTLWCVIGVIGGLESGIGYKAVQSTSRGQECSGPCPYDAHDWYNYYWLYDVKEIVNAESPWEARPFDKGVWSLPHVTIPESHQIIGATVDGRGSLYVALSNAGQVDEYDRPPLILEFKFASPEGSQCLVDSDCHSSAKIEKIYSCQKNSCVLEDVPSFCGNHVCDGSEDCHTCAEDCQSASKCDQYVGKEPSVGPDTLNPTRLPTDSAEFDSDKITISSQDDPQSSGEDLRRIQLSVLACILVACFNFYRACE